MESFEHSLTDPDLLSQAEIVEKLNTKDGLLQGVVFRKTIGNYEVHLDGRVVPCTLSNRLRKQLIYPTADPNSLRHRVREVKEIEHVDPVAVGDRVSFVDAQDGTGVIVEVLPRRSMLRRKTAVPRPGAHAFEQIFVTNIDQVVPVFAAANPVLKWGLLDRYLALAESMELPALICITKMDLANGKKGINHGDTESTEKAERKTELRTESMENKETDEWRIEKQSINHGDTESTEKAERKTELRTESKEKSERKIDQGILGAIPDDSILEELQEYQRIGYRVILTSTVTGEGMDELREALRGKVSVLLGKSGVGKTSLLNALQPGLGLRVNTVNRATGKGKHTTTYFEMFPLEFGGAIVDTPGVREFGLWEMDDTELALAFPEMRPFVGKCKFGLDCRHEEEPGCAIRKAVIEGRISPRRYHRFLALKAGN